MPDTAELSEFLRSAGARASALRRLGDGGARDNVAVLRLEAPDPAR